MGNLYSSPVALSDALSMLAGDDWNILAGGTDFYPSLKEAMPVGNVLDISKIAELDEIAMDDEGRWVIGARVTWTDVIEADLPPAFEALKLAAREVGSIQIQNRATLVGNLCNASPAADGVPPLLALNTMVRIGSVNGEREVSLDAFIHGNRDTDLKPDEMVTHLVIPSDGARGVSSFLKLGARKYLVISISMVAARLSIGDDGLIDDAAISVGSCSAVAQRLGALEKRLVGQDSQTDFTGLIEADDLAPLSPIDDVRASGDYRMIATKELVVRTL
ncbi:MAG: FAD binding domain-containing protein, partial [Hyphomicrobiales bacterium]